MNSKKTSAKEKILLVALEYLASEKDIENITSRYIAEKAGVNHAMINYYYQSKENLFSQAADIMMGKVVYQVFDEYSKDEDSVTKLKRLLTSTANFSFKHNNLFRVTAAKDIKEGCRNSCSLVIPLLKDIFKNKDESELRIIALQLILPCLNIVLYPEIYNDYLNTDFFDNKQRTIKINQIVDNVLLGNGG